MSDRIRCYANLTRACYEGKDHPVELDPWREDGTYREDLDAIVCDPCYIVVNAASPSGFGHLDEVEPTIKRLRAARR